MQDAFWQIAGPVGRTIQRLAAPALVAAAIVGQPNLTSADEAPARVARRSEETSPAASKKPGLAQVIKVAQNSRARVTKLQDYTYTFEKRELIGEKVLRQKMTMKVRQEPFGVYVKYLDPHPGREVIYADGQNQGKLLVHEDGFKALAGTLAFSPTSEQVMKENRYPITQAGMLNMLDAVLAIWQAELPHGEAKIGYYPQAKVGESSCKVYEVTHAEAREHFKFHKTRLYIDIKSGLPVRVEQYAFPVDGAEAKLVEEYTFSDLKTNVGLTDNDFSTKNKSYNF